MQANIQQSLGDVRIPIDPSRELRVRIVQMNFTPNNFGGCDMCV